MKKLGIIFTAYTAFILGMGGVLGIQLAPVFTHAAEPAIVMVPQYIEVIKEIPTLRVERVEVIKEVPIHNESGLHEFNSRRDLQDYIRWYRNEKMVQHGPDQCEDYAYDFMMQAIADGYVVSTEMYEKKIFDVGLLHMANTVPVGNEVYLVEISAGSIKLIGLKD